MNDGRHRPAMRLALWQLTAGPKVDSRCNRGIVALNHASRMTLDSRCADDRPLRIRLASRLRYGMPSLRPGRTGPQFHDNTSETRGKPGSVGWEPNAAPRVLESSVPSLFPNKLGLAGTLSNYIFQMMRLVRARDGCLPRHFHIHVLARTLPSPQNTAEVFDSAVLARFPPGI